MHGALLSQAEVDEFVILRVRRFTSTIRRSLTQDVLKDEGLSTLEWRLLFSIARFGSCHVGHITQHTSIDPAHGSRAATTLEKKGLIERIEDKENKRRKIISLTDEGLIVFKRVWPLALGISQRLTDRLSQDEMKEFRRLLDLMNTPSDEADNIDIVTDDML